jgi:hypothetical protein
MSLRAAVLMQIADDDFEDVSEGALHDESGTV